ncbi:hypothetical protein [Chroococcus sp. FPU101]|uniref:hypothetical protein n=1 Tax=Chroococcus sp. FPU101 TaxID=1974212 RepID=UPI001AAA2A31|nr:hypothetical protein [Chroococcus sp. FPU101]GFE71255.1 hypothetical protein CFPU101_38650 [Chroococcus sp. FPU101]
MKQSTTENLKRFKRYLEEYSPQLEKALAAIKTLEKSDSESEEFSDILAKL